MSSFPTHPPKLPWSSSQFLTRFKAIAHCSTSLKYLILLALPCSTCSMPQLSLYWISYTNDRVWSFKATLVSFIGNIVSFENGYVIRCICAFSVYPTIKSKINLLQNQSWDLQEQISPSLFSLNHLEHISGKIFMYLVKASWESISRNRLVWNHKLYKHAV